MFNVCDVWGCVLKSFETREAAEEYLNKLNLFLREGAKIEEG